MVRKYIGSISVVVALVIVGVVLAARNREGDPLPAQPIAFNHKLHLDKIQGVNCKDCHQFVLSQTYAGLPSKYVCFDCHDPTAGKSDKTADANKPQFASLMAFAKAPGDIPWRRVTAMEEHVFFSHRRHVVVAKLDCRECHAYMPGRTSPLDRGPIRMTMNACLACHQQKKASEDCVSCHR